MPVALSSSVRFASDQPECASPSSLKVNFLFEPTSLVVKMNLSVAPRWKLVGPL